jgi:integrase/recombinase XerD
MSPLADALADYLRTRRALGYKLNREEQHLRGFVDYAERVGADAVTTDLALAWATAPAGADPYWHALRLSAVRGFARYLSTRDPATQIPPPRILPARTHRAVPYLFTDAEIVAVMTAASGLRSRLGAGTHTTLIGLLAVTGMFSGGQPRAAA